MPQPRQPLEQMTLRQLRKIASMLQIPRYSRMRKAQLLKSIQIRQKNLHSDSFRSLTKKKPTNSEAKKELVESENIDNLLSLKTTDIGETQTQVPQNSFYNCYALEFLADVDDDLGDLPTEYGTHKIVLMPCEPQWAYVYWDIPSEEKDKLRQRGGINLFLRLHDITPNDSDYRPTFTTFEHIIANQSTNNWYLPIPISDRTVPLRVRNYVVEIGYRRIDGKWLGLARSQPVSIPALYPSDWQEDIFVSLPWQKPLNGKKIWQLPPQKSNYVNGKSATSTLLPHSALKLIPGSISSLNPPSSHQFPSGVGQWLSGKGWMSGLGLVSGVGFNPSHEFWLMANAKLTIYGATVPNAKVTIASQDIPLNADGTFSLQTAFSDGVLEYPIVAISEDGQDSRTINLKFERQTQNNPRQEVTNEDFFPPVEFAKNVHKPSNQDEDDISDWFPPIR